MRHRVFGRKLGRTKDEIRLLFRNLVGEFIVHGRIKTTLARAKAIKPLIDKLVTKAKKATIAQRRGLLGVLPKEAAIILINTVAPQLKNRTSGFSRIIHLEERLGDDAAMVLLEWVEKPAAVEVIDKKIDKIDKVDKKQRKPVVAKPAGRAKKRKVVKKA